MSEDLSLKTKERGRCLAVRGDPTDQEVNGRDNLTDDLDPYPSTGEDGVRYSNYEGGVLYTSL